MGGNWSTHFEIYFVSLLTWDGFGQHRLRCIFCPRWDGIGLVNTSSDIFYVLAGMEGVWSTHVEKHFVSSLACEAFGQNMLRGILCLRWHRLGLVNTC